MYLMMASSNLSPPTRTEPEYTMPPSEITPTSVVPPPMSTTIEPVASATGRSAPMAAAMGSSIRYTWPAPAPIADSRIARRSTCVEPQGTQMMMRGEGDNRGLVQDNALAPHVDERVGGAEVDGQVVGKVAAQESEHGQGRGLFRFLKLDLSAAPRPLKMAAMIR